MCCRCGVWCVVGALGVAAPGRGGNGVCVIAVRCQVRVGVRGSIFISGCQGGDTLMNGAE